MSEFLYEIGTEELPASFVMPALKTLDKRLKELLSKAGLEVTTRLYATPRRLTLIAEGLPAETPRRT